MKKNKNKNNKIWLISGLILSIIAVACIITVILMSGGCSATKKPDTVTTVKADSTTITEAELPDNPIDFTSLYSQNEEIYAWIKIPNTNVDYPILQSTADDNYYLHRNIDKNYEFGGCLYTQSLNKRNFSDRNTVIYGHNMKDNSYFGTLSYFRDPDFFNKNDVFYIYTPGHILTYKIFAAYEYDNRHILNSFDFNNDDIFSEYLKSCQNPQSLVQNVREGVTLDLKSKIVTLSTCVPSLISTQRYLVQGVLIKDEKTK